MSRLLRTKTLMQVSPGRKSKVPAATKPPVANTPPGVFLSSLDSGQLLGFTVGCLASRYDEPKPVPAFHEEMWELCLGDAPQVAIAAPRGHAKSTAITFAYALAQLLFRQAQHLLIISANESLAAAFLNDIRAELEENEVIQQLFGPLRMVKSAETELIVQCPDKHRWRVIVKGSGQRMRGLKWERKRPDLVIGDDLEDDEIVLNAERREKFRRWFYGAVRPIVRSGGKIRLVGTIIHMDSLLERTMPGKTHPATHTSTLKDWTTEPQKGWLSARYRAHDPEFTTILWPGQFSAAKLRELRSEYAEMGLLDVYGQEYLNYPLDESTSYFRRQDFLPMTDHDRALPKTFYVGVDLAISEKKKAAMTCLVIGGVDERGRLHIVDVRRGQWDALAILDEIYSVHKRWQPALFRFEEENIARSLLPVLQSAMLTRGFIGFDTRTPSRDKPQRARAFQYRTRAGNVLFDKEADWYADFEEELTHFPKWPRLDQVDAAAWLGDLLSEETPAPSAQELDEEAYAELLDTDTGYGGASAVTGY